MDLSYDEWIEYIGLIVAFGEAKRDKLYDKSDDLRVKLSKWQEGMPDSYFLDMWQSGRFEFHPVFEQQGEGSNFHLRNKKRQAQMVQLNM